VIFRKRTLFLNVVCFDQRETVDQWFLIGCAPPPKGASINFHGDASTLAPYKWKVFVIEFPNKYTCFYSTFKVRWASNKENFLREAWQKKVKIYCCSHMFIECICEWTICAVKMVRESTTKSCCVL